MTDLSFLRSLRGCLRRWMRIKEEDNYILLIVNLNKTNPPPLSLRYRLVFKSCAFSPHKGGNSRFRL